MAWFEETGKEQKYVLSTRVRFARNIADYPFASRMDKTSAAEIVERVRAALPQFEYTDFTAIDPTVVRSMMEKHFVSPDFQRVQYAHGLLTAGHTYIMVGEEDHLRIQSIYPGLAFDEAYADASAVCDAVEDKLNIAYNDTLGYLTHCPTNLGTGMRASVMLFLPAMSLTGQMGKIAAQLAKLGLTIRGSYGEGSDESGYLYQVSNQITLGVSEEDTITKLREVVAQLIENEKQLEKALDQREHDKLCDLSSRALGTLRYATLLSGAEFMELYGKVRLGLNMGYFSDVTYECLDRLSIATCPATLALAVGAAGADQRDRARADKVRRELREHE